MNEKVKGYEMSHITHTLSCLFAVVFDINIRFSGINNYDFLHHF